MASLKADDFKYKRYFHVISNAWEDLGWSEWYMGQITAHAGLFKIWPTLIPLSQCQWRNLEGYGEIEHMNSLATHNKITTKPRAKQTHKRLLWYMVRKEVLCLLQEFICNEKRPRLIQFVEIFWYNSIWLSLYRLKINQLIASINNYNGGWHQHPKF